MTISYVNNESRHRVEMYADDVLAGVEVYSLDGDVLTFVHTEIYEQFAGRHIGTLLASHVLDDARRQGLRVIPECPFIRSFIADHEAQYLDLVPLDQRERFNLPRDDS